MKKILGALLVLATSFNTFAQTLNNGTFENWANSGGVESPAGWTTLDQIYGLPLGTVTKSTSKNSGTFAAKISVVSFLGSGSIPGVLSYGISSASASGQVSGTPYTHRPDKFQFYYQYNLSSPDTTFAFASLTRWDAVNQVSELIGFAEVIIDAATNSYTLAEASFVYSSNMQPDTLMLIFFASTATNPAVGTTLYVDDVKLTGATTTTAVKEAVTQPHVQVYPNPSADGVFYIKGEFAGNNTKAEVYSLTGQKVYSQNIDSNITDAQPLHLQSLPKGAYFLNFSNETQRTVQRIIIQ
ncbi:MAG: T9SS type A sorting domain-containing protein [Hymenobacteraceae bacterium]|nr:T9SS type A sorting domain-containing protein [Hymenobacteraceae bacterium]MDX5397490.1 T9SS type A sorting domain-containing protein [Hymenobacteraceae bacterium]MDX5442328.1 T9SS type A sorting domain-containing protein [Hymenobacteraceae bacterium]MDX5513566.1 T9SS type A sorting domain-containing protein [Hymenobacteraceae bacterium]